MHEPAFRSTRGLRVEEVGVAADLVHRPVHDVVAAGDELERRVGVSRTDLRAVDHVVEHVAAADGLAVLPLGVDVVDLLDLDRRT